MAKAMQGHRKSVGTGAVIHFRANDELVGRVIAEKLRRDRLAFQSKAEVRP